MIVLNEAFEDITALAPARVVIAGDWHKHSFANHAIHVMKYAKLIGADGIIHVGDLGYNFDAKNDKDFDKPLRDALEEFDLFMLWIDGNHDNHEWLQSLPKREDGFVQTGAGGRLFYIPRGTRWEWAGTRFAGLGGAFSVNKNYLDEGKTLFEDLEQVQPEDVVRLGNEKLDVLFTHDVPTGVRVKKHIRLVPEFEKLSAISRTLIRKAVENTRPDDVFSGHWHQRRDEELIRAVDGGQTTVHILDMEWNVGNIAIYDVFEKTTTPIDHNWKELIKINQVLNN